MADTIILLGGGGQKNYNFKDYIIFTAKNTNTQGGNSIFFEGRGANFFLG